MTSRQARITFNEVVRCARIVECTIQTIGTEKLKSRTIVFKPRGEILSNLSGTAKISVFSMECTVETIAKPEPKITTVNGWFVDVDTRIYFEDSVKRDVIRTTPVVTIEGNVVTTRSGSKYALGKMDVLIAKHLASVKISESAPLEEETLPFLVNAAYDVYPNFTELFGR
jgi:hypothetical protein